MTSPASPEWVTVMEDVVHVSDAETKEGTVYREVSKIGPSRSETEWRITTFDPPRIQVHECKEPTLRAVLTMKVEPEGQGSRFIHQQISRCYLHFVRLDGS